MHDTATIPCASGDPSTTTRPPEAAPIWHVESFEGVYNNHAGPIYRFLFFRSGMQEATATELTAEVFLALWRMVPPPEAETPAVLYGIARRKLADCYRQRRIRREVRFADLSDPERRQVQGLLSDAPDTEAPALSEQLRAMVGETLTELDEETQELLLDKYVRGSSVRELCERTRRSETAVMSQLARARARLREALRAKIPEFNP